ncbi:hypothetical protein [Azomonas macrocytogenes]|uniref:Uncharacterized protein n=1 Tax=Azomonas macrocytogenes TaxID=69962 RepID=A0A839T2W1_AZOMA|nr:hypothetical protein [Azomonas macrocytogenes]MBB3103339.1 hypothetical protein [Azomonas macrocytogenes]
MPDLLLSNGTHLHYQCHGRGPALLALAPGGLHSRSELWAYVKTVHLVALLIRDKPLPTVTL